jgi:hypothetical protein
MQDVGDKKESSHVVAQDQMKPVTALPVELAAPPAASVVPTAAPAAAVPSSLVAISSTLSSIAVPVSKAAGTVLRLCYRGLAGGVSRALRLRSDWKEGQGARRKLAAVMRLRAQERIAAKKREQEAMERLQQLEQMIQAMQQQLMAQPPMSQPAAAAVVTVSPIAGKWGRVWES